MELKIREKKVSKKLLAVPVILIASYLFFFWGKPMDVSWGIWYEAKKIYGYYEEGIETIDRNGDLDIEIRKFQYKHAKEAYANEVFSKYSENERVIVKSIGSVLHNGRICMDDQVSDEAKKFECYDYEESLKTLGYFFD
jgi:hypothetical protein